MNRLNIPPSTLIGAIGVALAVTAILVDTLSGQLAYADKPAKVDALVLFIGPDNSRSRMRKVNSLIVEGYSDRLIIPAYGQLLAMKDADHFSSEDPDTSNRIPCGHQCENRDLRIFPDIR
jgi:hypothetical protein